MLAVLLASSRAAFAQWAAVPLHPGATFEVSRLYAVTPTEQFGQSSSGGLLPTGWRGGASSVFTLSSGGGGTVLGAWQDRQVGDHAGRASLWRGTPESRVDLHQPGWSTSKANAVWGDEQVGGYYPLPNNFQPRAVMWHGSAESWVSLHPAGAESSGLSSVWNGQQGGGVGYPGYAQQAAIWSGTASSVVNLHPGSQFRSSYVTGMAEGHQVGYAGRIGQPDHAAMWHGTAKSYTDLNPSIAGLSTLYGTCGTAQVGYANTNLYGITAGIWFGTAESFTALSPFLPSGYGQSIATSVATDGARFYVGGYARNLMTNRDEAFLWIGVPAPGSAWMLGALGILAAKRKRSLPR